MADPSTPRVAPVPPGVHMRRPVHDDAAAIVAVVRAAETAACGHSLASVGDVLYDWADPRFSLERDAWVAVDEDGMLVAYAYSWATDPTETIDVYGVVHPDVDERGLNEHLMDVALQRAREQAETAGLDVRDVTVSAWCLRGDARRRELYERLGFRRTRVFLLMVIGAADLPEPPPWPEGITVTPFRPGLDDRTLHAVLEEAFLDHFRPRGVPFDVWAAQVLGDPDFDPDLVLIARNGDDAAGAVIALTLPDAGCVVQLGVRRPWRGRGLGTALLMRAMHLLAARGCESLSLGVDSESPTGAADLYRRAGMRPQHENDIYERALGEGA